MTPYVLKTFGGKSFGLPYWWVDGVCGYQVAWGRTPHEAIAAALDRIWTEERRIAAGQVGTASWYGGP